MNSALEMRNTVLEKTNAELTTQHRNDVIRIHAIEKEVSCPSRDMGPGFSKPEFCHQYPKITAASLLQASHWVPQLTGCCLRLLERAQCD